MLVIKAMLQDSRSHRIKICPPTCTALYINLKTQLPPWKGDSTSSYLMYHPNRTFSHAPHQVPVHTLRPAQENVQQCYALIFFNKFINRSPSYITAKHLATLPQSLVGQSKYHITNSKHFVDIISYIQPTDTLV